jgi:hypothetical protein
MIFLGFHYILVFITDPLKKMREYFFTTNTNTSNMNSHYIILKYLALLKFNFIFLIYRLQALKLLLTLAVMNSNNGLLGGFSPHYNCKLF